MDKGIYEIYKVVCNFLSLFCSSRGDIQKSWNVLDLDAELDLGLPVGR